MRDEIDRATLERKDLTRIWDIGPVRARRLEEIGIKTYDDLLAVDSASVVQKLREQMCFVSAAQVDRWKHHAASYSTSAPVLFGEPLNLDGRFLGGVVLRVQGCDAQTVGAVAIALSIPPTRRARRC
jgi:hypothetical protein